MATRCKTFLIAVLSAMALGGQALAGSVPQLINYQGRLADSSGQPLSGSVDLTFTFYDAASGGTVLLTVVQNSVTVTNGLYNVLIGSGVVTPGAENSLADVFSRHADVWMGVKVNTDPEMSPRSRITGVGYAFHSETADLAASVNPGSILASSIGEHCLVGEVLAKTAAGWGCRYPGVADQWVWVSGGNTTNQLGTYGSKGSPDPANVPGSRRRAASWIDGSGNLWLFGGYGYATSTASFLNDLWKWDGTSWTWISGSNMPMQTGTYGAKGTPDPANVPGARYGAITWIDGSGNLWLFGGYGWSSDIVGHLNDLWRWDGTNWTWMSGSTTAHSIGTYGIEGSPAPANVPGARMFAVSWMDASGDMWLFGGFGHGASAGGYLNDLWRWDGTYWTWMSGSKDVNQIGVYGTKGSPDPANVPGSRYQMVSWKDASGKFWVFGGNGYDTATTGALNDLWKWDGTDWTWVSGADTVNQSGVYGVKGSPDPANVPGGRAEAVPWIDPSGDMWLFGGNGYAAATNGYLDDSWKWDGQNWTWMGGSDAANPYGTYGQKGTPALANIPGGRSGAISWIDASGNPWVFGGFGYAATGTASYLNDLWKYYP